MNEVLITIALALSICVNVIFSMLYFQPKPTAAQETFAEPSATDETLTGQSAGETDDLDPANLTYGRVCHYSAAMPGPLDDKLVFIADDIPENIEVLIEMLGQLGLSRYVLARNGKEAVALFYNHAFDIAYMDIQMPIMNGLDAAENIKAIPEHCATPIIPITAHSRVVTQELCEQCGLSGFLQKPVMLDELRQATQNAIQVHEPI